MLSLIVGRNQNISWDNTKAFLSPSKIFCPFWVSVVWMMSTGPHAVLQKVCQKVGNRHFILWKLWQNSPFRPMFPLRKISNWIYWFFSPSLSFLCVLPLTTGPWRQCSSSAARCCRSPAAASSGRRWAEPSNTGTRLHQCSGPLTRTGRAKGRGYSALDEKISRWTG